MGFFHGILSKVTGGSRASISANLRTGGRSWRSDDILLIGTDWFSGTGKIYAYDGRVMKCLGEREGDAKGFVIFNDIVWDYYSNFSSGVGYLHETVGGELALTRKGTTIHVMCEHDAKLYDAGLSGEIYDTFSGQIVARRKGQVHSLCSHLSSLYDGGDYNSVFDTFTGREVATRSGLVWALESFNGELYDAGDYGAVYQTFANRCVTTRTDPDGSSARIKTLLVHEGQLVDSGDTVASWRGNLVSVDSCAEGPGKLLSPDGSTIATIPEDRQMVSAMLSVPKALLRSPQRLPEQICRQTMAIPSPVPRDFPEEIYTPELENLPPELIQKVLGVYRYVVHIEEGHRTSVSPKRYRPDGTWLEEWDSVEESRESFTRHLEVALDTLSASDLDQLPQILMDWVAKARAMTKSPE
ncbi:MAG: hypothetical protein QGH60_10900 [Phycisphaerae bacterium]|jgi:hypothetical protein|nr:hypothetical protein [Phycisphaerae bacterium]